MNSQVIKNSSKILVSERETGKKTQATPVENKITRFYLLDILRGFAALSVVLWHWQHFFYDNHILSIAEQHVNTNNFPFYNILRPFYGQGWRAVEFFFTLSGFIFFWLYSEKIAKKQIVFSKYFKLRISRLYPLHVIMLVIVIIEQYFYFLQTGLHFVYQDYSVLSFISNLTLTNNWFNSSFSFNGPTWSISVELFLYILFFTFCLIKANRIVLTLLLVGLGLLLKGTQLDALATGIISFFTGGIAFYLYRFLQANFGKKGNILFMLFTFFCAVFAIIFYRYILRGNLPFYFFEFFLFPAIIINTALLETIYGAKGSKPFVFIGDISYSSYLIHFPLQLAFVLIINYFNLSTSVFSSPLMLIIFYIILIVISLCSYNYIERPAQRFLRRKWTD